MVGETKGLVLIVEDDKNIAELIHLYLVSHGYKVEIDENGTGVEQYLKGKKVDLIILDLMLPYLDGLEICKKIREQGNIPVIILTAKGDIKDKLLGFNLGADDYIVKPFEPKELLARIRMVLRRTEIDLEANPLTRLPGNISILNELARRIENKALFAVCYLDLDKFKAYNDKYGFEHGDEVIRETARILIQATHETGNPDDFIGHIGGDDFVIVTTPNVVDSLCKRIIVDFEKTVPSFYNETDRKKGYIIGHDRQGREQRIPLLSISIGVVTNEFRKIEHVAQIGEIGAELKAYAKSLERSNYVKDKRKPR